MLDAKSLELLQSLKSEIQASKDVFSGTVKGTGRSFGFVIRTDGEEFFLPPSEMSKVFPGDEVNFTVIEQDDGKKKAELNALVQSNLKEILGVFNVRGKGQGVTPNDKTFSGWLFVPPKHTQQAQNNDIVVAKVVRHPWQTGKAQAEVIEVLGNADNNRTWYSMVLRNDQIPEKFTDQELEAAEALAEMDLSSLPGYNDLTDRPFITIDSKSTRDMDDALTVEITDSGWCLSVAVADASLFIEPNSLIDMAAKKRLTTTYLPGLTLPMVPSVLANEAMSLKENERRPALVFHLSILADGSISDFNVETAIIKSQGKLTYSDVSDWLDGASSLPAVYSNLTTLKEATQALATWRATNANPSMNRADYRIQVDEQFNPIGVKKEERNIARDIVEEAMIATNHQVAHWLKDDDALFMTHAGFKPDRETELKGLLRIYAKGIAELDSLRLDDFRQIMSAARLIEDYPLATVLQKRFDRGQWSASAKPHFGLGLPYYTNATSPIRKYADLVIHRIIKAKLRDQSFNLEPTLLEELNRRGNMSRSVGNTVENKLRLQWLNQQEASDWDACIVHINANGIVAQLTDNGAVGFIDLRKTKNEYTYDPLRMILKYSDFQYQLGQPLQVTIQKIDDDGLTLEISESKIDAV